MYESMGCMSIWELAHRWVDENPMVPDNSPIPLNVQPILRALSSAVARGQLLGLPVRIFELQESNPDDPTYEAVIDPQHYFPMSVETLDALISTEPNRKVLDGVFVQFVDVFYWVTKQRPIPDFPDFIVPEWAWSKTEKPPNNEQTTPAQTSRRPKEELISKALCQGAATALWHEHPDMPIAQVSKHGSLIKLLGKDYEETTRYRWVREVAPESVKNRPGRPSKTSTES